MLIVDAHSGCSWWMLMVDAYSGASTLLTLIDHPVRGNLSDLGFYAWGILMFLCINRCYFRVDLQAVSALFVFV